MRSVVVAFDMAIRACGSQAIVAMCNIVWSKTVYHNKQNTARKNGHFSHWQPVSRKAQKTAERTGTWKVHKIRQRRPRDVTHAC